VYSNGWFPPSRNKRFTTAARNIIPTNKHRGSTTTQLKIESAASLYDVTGLWVQVIEVNVCLFFGCCNCKVIIINTSCYSIAVIAVKHFSTTLLCVDMCDPHILGLTCLRSVEVEGQVFRTPHEGLWTNLYSLLWIFIACDWQLQQLMPSPNK